MWHFMNWFCLPHIPPSASFSLYLLYKGVESEGPQPPTSWWLSNLPLRPQSSLRILSSLYPNISKHLSWPLYSPWNTFTHRLLCCRAFLVFFNSVYSLIFSPFLAILAYPRQEFSFYGFDTMIPFLELGFLLVLPLLWCIWSFRLTSPPSHMAFLLTWLAGTSTL
jgi:hypothetical protein